ncbi:hypothetical protein RI129_003878 [Pyrocoelia pectoralis]|uniref:Uncharacterized protein n=1 Tax=Pyrocoelia pectoralis TaxID=417401 RepID=A0AAN7VQE4_9COLE
METSFMIFSILFLLFVISLLILSFGDPRHAFTETNATATQVNPNESHNKSYPHMPSPPPHITKGMHRAPSLNSPYPASPPPLGFELAATLPTPTDTEQTTLPYPLGEIPQMPRPVDPTNFCLPNLPPNEWSYVEEQIVRDVAGEPPHEIHPPSYEEAIGEDSALRHRQTI